MDIEDILERKLEILFPDKEVRNEVEKLLSAYGVESYEQEPIRVRLAILKLSGVRPTIEKVSDFASSAKGDFRDVLAWAEYPRQFDHSSPKESEKKQQLVQADLAEYQSWLKT